MILDRRYYERKNMETKGAEDVLGGADSWKNVDKTEGMRDTMRCWEKPRSPTY
jgi:DNA-directed RNA polymerase III subunit RPC11